MGNPNQDVQNEQDGSEEKGSENMAQAKHADVAKENAPEEKKELSFGEKVVRTNFNASGDSMVDNIKMKFADLLNQINDYRTAVGQTNPDAGRCASIAITHLETAAMYAVKAVTA